MLGTVTWGWLAPLSIIGLFALIYFSVRTGSLADVEVGEREVVIRAHGLNGIWALRRKVVIPRDAIVAVRVGVRRAEASSGVRMPGTAVPGLITAGTYRKRGIKTFWLVGRAKQVTVIECPGQQYDAVVLEVDETVTAGLVGSLSPSGGRHHGTKVRRVGP